MKGQLTLQVAMGRSSENQGTSAQLHDPADSSLRYTQQSRRQAYSLVKQAAAELGSEWKATVSDMDTGSTGRPMPSSSIEIPHSRAPLSQNLDKHLLRAGSLEDEFETFPFPETAGTSGISNIVGSRDHYGSLFDRIKELELGNLAETGHSPATELPDRGEASELLARAHGDFNASEDELDLLNVLLSCAKAISRGQLLEARKLLTRLDSMVSFQGSPVQRVAAYFTEALCDRLIREAHKSYVTRESCNSTDELMNATNMPSSSGERIYRKCFPSDKHLCLAFRAFYALCPYLIISHLTINQAILEVFEGKKELHIIDLDIMDGSQWPALIQALATREAGPPSSLRLTVVGTEMELPGLLNTKRRLLEFSDLLRLHLEVSILTLLGSFHRCEFDIREGEALAVNCGSFLSKLSGEVGSDPSASFTGLLHSLQPSLISLREPDIDYEGSYMSRFAAFLRYHCCMFTSLAASLPALAKEREIVETWVFGREIRDTVASDEGMNRMPGGSYRSASGWRRCMETAGFQPRPLSERSTLQAKFILEMYAVSDQFEISIDETGQFSMGWNDHPLFFVSCWR